MDIQEKVAILRKHECYCYQVSFYLIQDEKLSIKVTSAALLELAVDPHFFYETDEKQKEQVKKIAIRSSLKHRKHI